jgi:hypothetical protein
VSAVGQRQQERMEVNGALTPPYPCCELGHRRQMGGMRQERRNALFRIQHTQRRHLRDGSHQRAVTPAPCKARGC